MGKKLLAIYYSQAGQLEEIINQFLVPLEQEAVSVERVKIVPKTEYPFPWTKKQFYSVMPDCVRGASTELAPFVLKESSYDLIVIGYQPWFLFPSIPANSFLSDSSLRAALKDTPVITISGARNMWLNAFAQVKASLLQADARLVGNIALVDRHQNHISFVTIFHWLLKGKKDKFLTIFPYPGVSAKDIAHSRVFGEIVTRRLRTNDWAELQKELMTAKAVELTYSLMLLESKAIPTYIAWAGFIARRKKRDAWLTVFRYYLLFSLFIAAPVLLAVDLVFIRPFSSRRIKAKKQQCLALE